MAEQEQNRSEPATPEKLKEARRRGQWARSPEMQTTIAVATLAAAIAWYGQSMMERLLRLSRMLLQSAGALEVSAGGRLGSILTELLALLMPLLAGLMIAGVLAGLAQTGPIVTFYPLKPDASRLNPIAGFKRLFSVRIIVETVKCLIKITLLATVAFLAIRAMLAVLLAQLSASPASQAHALMTLSAALLAKLAGALMLIAALDWIYVRRDFAARMRMSRRELREEIRRRDGDPRIRARQRELQQEARKRGKALGRVKEADVLIANPTHLAVAIRYDRSSMPAPQVLTKGAGELALAMREIARRHRIPVVENPPLARALFRQVDVQGVIPESLYADVARLLAWVYAMRENAAPRSVA